MPPIMKQRATKTTSSESGKLIVSGAWFRWGLLYPADSMGGAFQFFEVVIASFAIAAIVGGIATFVFVKPGPKIDSSGDA